MKFIKTAAVTLIAAVLLLLVCSCGTDKSGYMTNRLTKDGVSEFLQSDPELSKFGFTEKATYNVTPEGFNGITLFKSADTAYTAAVYPGYSYSFLDMSNAPGMISAVTCDADGNGITDILFTYSDKTAHKYGIGVFNGVLGYSSSVFSAEGDLALYLVRQKAEEGEPDIFSVLAVTVTVFNDNPADLGCTAIQNVGTVTLKDNRPVFNADSGEKVNIVDIKYDDIAKIIISSLPNATEHDKTVVDKADIGKIADYVKNIKTAEEETPPQTGTTYILAFVYEDGAVAYAYVNENGYFKLHGENWRKADISDMPF